MRKKLTKLCITLCYAILTSNALAQHSEYVVLRSERVANDAKWAAVSDKLATKHSATIINYVDTPCEAIDILRQHKPRYVATVEQPEAINRDSAIDFHCISCNDVFFSVFCHESEAFLIRRVDDRVAAFCRYVCQECFKAYVFERREQIENADSIEVDV